jgi:hypothetical protein
MAGKPIGAMKFKGMNELGEFVQSRISPGDIYKRNLESMKLKRWITLKNESEVSRTSNEARASLVNNRRGIKIQYAPLDQTYGETERRSRYPDQCGCGGLWSGKGAALSNARIGYLGSNARRRNFGFRMGLPQNQRGQFDAALRGSSARPIIDPTVVASQRAR